MEFTEDSKNNKSLTLEETKNDLIWDNASMTWDEAQRPFESPGQPVTKTTKNNKSLTNTAENL